MKNVLGVIVVGLILMLGFVTIANIANYTSINGFVGFLAAGFVFFLLPGAIFSLLANVHSSLGFAALLIWLMFNGGVFLKEQFNVNVTPSMQAEATAITNANQIEANRSAKEKREAESAYNQAEQDALKYPFLIKYYRDHPTYSITAKTPDWMIVERVRFMFFNYPHNGVSAETARIDFPGYTVNEIKELRFYSFCDTFKEYESNPNFTPDFSVSIWGADQVKESGIIPLPKPDTWPN